MTESRREKVHRHCENSTKLNSWQSQYFIVIQNNIKHKRKKLKKQTEQQIKRMNSQSYTRLLVASLFTMIESRRDNDKN